MQSIFSLFHFASRIFFSFIFIPHNSLLSITNSVLYILLLFLYLCFFYFQFCLLSTCLFFFTSSSFTFCTQWSRIRHIVATRAHKMYCLHYTNTWIVGLMLYTFFCQDPVYLFLLSYLMSNILYLAISPLYFLFFFFLQVSLCYLLFLIFAFINLLSGLVSRKELEAFPLWRRFNTRDFQILPTKHFELLQIPIEWKGVRWFRIDSLFLPLCRW